MYSRDLGERVNRGDKRGVTRPPRILFLPFFKREARLHLSWGGEECCDGIASGSSRRSAGASRLIYRPPYRLRLRAFDTGDRFLYFTQAPVIYRPVSRRSPASRHPLQLSATGPLSRWARD